GGSAAFRKRRDALPWARAGPGRTFESTAGDRVRERPGRNWSIHGARQHTRSAGAAALARRSLAFARAARARFAGFVSPLDGRTAPARRPTRRVRNGGARHRRPALRLLRGTALDPDRQLPLRDRSARALPAPAQALVAATLDGRDGGGVLRFRGFRDA